MPTLLLLPTWTIIHSRFWRLQVPYPAHHFRVITFDRPGNGRSRWALDPNACAMATAVGRALAVLDATGTGSSVGGSRFLEGSAIVLAGSAAVAAALAMHAFG